MTDENSILSEENTETTPEPTIEPITEPTKELSTTDQVKNLIRKKIENGFQVTDKNSRILLQKTIIDELKLNGGWRGKVKEYIGEILTEKKISLAGLGISQDNVGGMKVNLIKNETETEKPTEPTQTATQQTFTKEKGALPKDWDPQSTSLTETERQEQEKQNPEKKYMSESAQERLIKKGLNDFLVPIYISLGVVEPDESEKEDEAQLPTAKKFRSDVDKFSTELNQYLIENNIKLPQFLNHISIIASIAILFVMPVIKWKYFSSKQTPKPNYDDKADGLEIKV